MLQPNPPARRRLLPAVALAAALAVGACGSDDSGTPPAPVAARIEIPGANVFPEGVATDPARRFYYVGSTTDGTIFRGSYPDATAAVFLPAGSDGRTDVRGLKVDARGRLFAATGNGAAVYVYDTQTAALLARLPTGSAAGASFVNDLAVSPSGDVYATDSRDPVLYRIATDAAGRIALERWLTLSGTPIVYGTGFNLNGIAATDDGRYLLTVQSNTGKLYRIGTADRSVVEVALGGATLANGDGLLLDGRTLYVVRNADQLVVELEMAADFAGARVAGTSTDASFAFPTTLARADDRLLVVNSQLNRRTAGTPPVLPFTLSNIALP